FICLPPREKLSPGKLSRAEFKNVTYPAGLSVTVRGGIEQILIACQGSDEAILLNAAHGEILHRFDLSTFKRIPGALPYSTVITHDGKRGFVSLWNASSVAELDLVAGKVRRMIPLVGQAPAPPQSSKKPPRVGGSHPPALLLTQNDSRLYVALTNADEIDLLDTRTGNVLAALSSKLRGQKYGGSDPESLALSPDEKTLLSADAISDSVAVFDLTQITSHGRLGAAGFIPTEF